MWTLMLIRAANAVDLAHFLNCPLLDNNGGVSIVTADSSLFQGQVLRMYKYIAIFLAFFLDHIIIS